MIGTRIDEGTAVMRNFKMIMIGLAAAMTAAPALAQNCTNPQSQADMNICAGKDYKASDAKLNAAYSEIVKRLGNEQEQKKLLLQSQRDWIAFRDAECAFSTAASKDGSIYPMLLSGCLQSLTDARTTQLNAYLNCQEGDMSCPVPAR